MRAHVKGEKRHGSRREAAVIGLRRRPGGRMVAASPSLHWPAAHLGNGLRPSTRTAVDSEVLPLDHAGAKPAKTSVQQG